MLEGLDISGKNVLEPSAGAGHLVDIIKLRSPKNVFICEIDETLVQLVKTKGIFLNNDFLKVSASEISHMDFIIMNPPFSKDDEHIVHAWEIAPPGCTIVSLCNNSLFTKYSPSRSESVVRQLVFDYGRQETLGSAFSSADRKTDVEIGIVFLQKPADDQETFDEFGDYLTMEDGTDLNQTEGIMRYDFVTECVNRYVGACKLYKKMMDDAVQMNHLAGMFGTKSLCLTLSEDDKPTTYERFKIELQKKTWNVIFEKMNMKKYMTESLKNDINKFCEEHSKYPFTVKNVYNMLNFIASTHGDRMQKVILEVFDRLTQHHHENRHNVKGWKTNSHYMLNKKIILPYVFEEGGKRIRYADPRYSNTDKLEDLTKVLCVLTGTNYDDILDLRATHLSGTKENYKANIRVDRETNTWYEWGFFEYKGFKAGTIHLKFKDENHWALFNQAVAKLKGLQLPDKF